MTEESYNSNFSSFFLRFLSYLKVQRYHKKEEVFKVKHLNSKFGSYFVLVTNVFSDVSLSVGIVSVSSLARAYQMFNFSSNSFANPVDFRSWRSGCGSVFGSP